MTDLVIKQFTALWYALKESYRPVKYPSLCKACAVGYGNYFKPVAGLCN